MSFGNLREEFVQTLGTAFPLDIYILTSFLCIEYVQMIGSGF